MQVRSPVLPRNLLEPEEAAAATLPATASPADDARLTQQLLNEVRRLRVIAEVADTVTRDLSLDHQLPRLIDLIIEALDA
jgi:hypothetical protein